MQDYLLKKSSRNGFWEIHWSTWDGKRNRSHSASTRTKDRNEAEAVLVAFREQVLIDAARANSGTLGALLDDYEMHAHKTGKGYTQRTVIARVKSYFGAYSPVDVTDQLVGSYQTTRGVADATARRDLGVLVAAINHAVRRTKKLAQADAPFILLPPPGAPRDVWLDETQERAFWDLALAHSEGKPRLTRITRFVALGLRTAARKSAIEKLTWDRVDLARGTIDYRDTGIRTSNKRRAVVPIARDLMPILERAYRERGFDPYVCGQGAIKSSWETWIRSPALAEFAYVTPHVMRHTVATLAMRRGVPMPVVAGFLGDTMATVERVYAHHRPDHLRGMIDHHV